MATGTRTMTVEEVADALGIGRTLARRLAREDGFPAPIRVIRIGRRMLIARAAVDAVVGLPPASLPTSDPVGGLK